MINKFKDFIKKYGKPKILHTDNVGELISNIFKNFCEEKINGFS